jgi:hypothetical protein
MINKNSDALIFDLKITNPSPNPARIKLHETINKARIGHSKQRLSNTLTAASISV